jgi:hypothetical protein
MCSLASDAGTEFVWQAEPAWPRHAPLLFPIVGRLANDELRHRGRTYRMTQHGFARDSRFAWAERGESRCVLVLEDSETTRALYPLRSASRQLMRSTNPVSIFHSWSRTPARRYCRPRSAAIPLSTGRSNRDWRRRATR